MLTFGARLERRYHLTLASGQRHLDREATSDQELKEEVAMTDKLVGVSRPLILIVRRHPGTANAALRHSRDRGDGRRTGVSGP